MNTFRVSLLIAFLAFTKIVSAQPVVFHSSERQTALVELYISEGCSSCPPAESWLSGLKKEPGLWSDFVPVAFHVEYWDNLGWRDKWSSGQFSDRQRSYAATWVSDTIYTPEFVLNRREWHNWFGWRGAPSLSDAKTGVLTVSYEGTNHWQANFVPEPGGTTGYEVNAALLDSELSSDVKAGENEGRHLNHDFAALTLLKEPLTGKDDRFQAEFTLDPNPKAAAGRLALAVWVTQTGEFEPLQAVGGWLMRSEKDK